MSEKNILAFFNSPEQAEGALRKLQSLRIVDSSIKRIDGYPGEGLDHIENPLTGDIPGLGWLTMNGDFSGRNAGILAAASVSASGMSTGGPENLMTGKDILLTAVVREEDHEMALKIVKDAGAEV
jgi:hypothetical protein